MSRIVSLLLFAFVLAVGLTGCGGADAEPKATAVSALTLAPVGNQMKFEQTEFTVKAGTEVTLTFNNTATSAAMEHNVVLLADNTTKTIDRVGQAALSAASSAYVPEDDAVLAATDLAKPGETVTLTFTAPSAPGEYAYVCTFPGHYAMMQGTMRVVK
jgi:azurin